jgi:hypothetical protein
MKKNSRRKKAKRSERDNILQMLMAEAFIRALGLRTSRTKNTPEIIDIPYEDVTDQKKLHN